MDLKQELKENVDYLRDYFREVGMGISLCDALKIAVQMQQNRILAEQIAMNLKYIAENGAK